jgi:hypothetical protein
MSVICASTRVPVQIEAPATAAKTTTRSFVGNLGIVFHASRVGTEYQTVLAIGQAVNNNLEAVGLTQGRIATSVGDNNAIGIIVIGHHSNVESVFTETDKDFSALRRWLPFVRSHLPKATGGRHLRPGRVIEHLTIDNWTAVEGKRGGAGIDGTAHQLLCTEACCVPSSQE